MLQYTRQWGFLVLGTKQSDIRFGLHVFEPRTPERVGRGYPLLRIELEHFVQQIQSRGGHERKVLAHPAPVRLLRAQSVPEGQFYHRWPDRRCRRAADFRNDVQLHHFYVGLMKKRVLKNHYFEFQSKRKEKQKKKDSRYFTWKSGFLENNSPRIQPQLQTSIAGP